MKNRFKNLSDRERMHRFGSEQVDGGMPRELQPPPRPHLSKGDLREMLARAVANTGGIKIQRVKSKRGEQ
jgi:hypothetical protein